MLTVVCFYWHDFTRGNRGYSFEHDYVRILKAMVQRNLTLPHRFVCVTDDIIDDVETLPLDYSKHIPGTVFLRLMQHKPETAEKICGGVIGRGTDGLIPSEC